MKTNRMKTDQKSNEVYSAPYFNVMHVIIEQNILQSASGQGTPLDMGGELW